MDDKLYKMHGTYIKTVEVSELNLNYLYIMKTPDLTCSHNTELWKDGVEIYVMAAQVGKKSLIQFLYDYSDH